MLAFEYNKFNGIIINSNQIPEDIDVFSPQLNALLSHAKLQEKSVIWLTLSISLAHLIAAATTQGFTFHNCLSTEVTLIFKSQPQDFVPFVPTHSLGAGGLVQNPQGEILVIREREATTYKLPGGHIELGEKIEDEVFRDVLEEPAIHTLCNSVLSVSCVYTY